MDFLFIGAILLLFLAVVLALEGGYSWWDSHYGPEAKRIQKRLFTIEGGLHSGLETGRLIVRKRQLSSVPLVQKALEKSPVVGRMDGLIYESGSNQSAAMVGLVMLMLFVASLLLLSQSLLPLPMMLMVALFVAAAPLAYLMYRREKRVNLMQQQIPDTLEMLGRAMQVGQAFSGALQMAALETADPLGAELQRVSDEVSYGISVSDAMKNLATRVPSKDLKLFALSVIVLRESGGSMSEVLFKISGLMRDRIELNGKVRALSADGRLSAIFLTLLPIIAGVLLWLLNPDMISQLWLDPVGIQMLSIGLVMLLVGALWMRKIVQIRY